MFIIYIIATWHWKKWSVPSLLRGQTRCFLLSSVARTTSGWWAARGDDKNDKNDMWFFLRDGSYLSTSGWLWYVYMNIFVYIQHTHMYLCIYIYIYPHIIVVHMLYVLYVCFTCDFLCRCILTHVVYIQVWELYLSFSLSLPLCIYIYIFVFISHIQMIVIQINNTHHLVPSDSWTNA